MALAGTHPRMLTGRGSTTDWRFLLVGCGLSRCSHQAHFRFLQPPQRCSEPSGQIRLPRPSRSDRTGVDSGLVLTSTIGTLIESRNLNRFFDELIARARSRRIQLSRPAAHLRVSPVLAQNVPARVVMEILGHSQLAMMTDLYFHVMPTAQREAADAVDRVFVQPN